MFLLLPSNISKCTFNEIWSENSAFRARLKPVENNEFEAQLLFGPLGKKASDFSFLFAGLDVKWVLIYIHGGLKKSLKFTLLKPAETLDVSRRIGVFQS